MKKNVLYQLGPRALELHKELDIHIIDTHSWLLEAYDKLSKDPTNKKLIEEHLSRFLSEQAEEDVTLAQMSRWSQGSDGQPKNPKKPQPGKGADQRDNGTIVKAEEAQNWLKDAMPSTESEETGDKPRSTIGKERKASTPAEILCGR